MAKLHIGTALAFFVTFLLTGAYMLVYFPDLYAGREEVRMMYRATHIYILLASLMNLMAGNLLLAAKLQRFHKLRAAASIALISTPVFFLAAFFIEPPRFLIDRPVSFFAMLGLLGSVLVLSLCFWLEKYWPKPAD